MQKECILEGIISVEAAIKYNSRKVELCYIDSAKVKKRDRKVTSFLSLLEKNHIRAEICDRELIDGFLASKSEDAGSSHGGVVAVCSERRFTPMDELLSETAEKGGFCALLDGVEDPYNFGYSVRNLYAAGACGVIIPERNWMTAAGVCARASAGATEMIKLSVMPRTETSDERRAFMKYLSDFGMTTVCAAKTGNCVEIFDFEPRFPLVLFIGGEKRGISPDFVGMCDSIVSIPYFSDARFSLPTASTAAIFGFKLAEIKENI